MPNTVSGLMQTSSAAQTS